MRAYAPDTTKGRIVARDDIHHKTADQPKERAVKAAKAARHAARQDARRVIRSEHP